MIQCRSTMDTRDGNHGRDDMAEVKQKKKKGGNHNENLIVPTSEKAREYGRLGGIASGKKKKERKSMAETLDILLNMPYSAGKVESLEELKSYGVVKSANITLGDKIMVAAVKKAMKGDIHAIEFIREVLGEGVQKTTISPLNELANKLDDFKDTDESEVSEDEKDGGE